MASVSESLSLAVAHAIVFLTAKLRATYAPNTLLKLQMVLEANLTAHYAASWSPKDPVRGSGRRCMTLSPDCLPPRPVWTACTAANVQWFDWIALLGNNEFGRAIRTTSRSSNTRSGRSSVDFIARSVSTSQSSSFATRGRPRWRNCCSIAARVAASLATRSRVA